MTEIFIHEDDYCQIELLPKDNFLLIHEEIKEIENSLGKQNSSYGFSNITSRNKVKIPLTSLNINRIDFENILKEEATAIFTKVKTGYSSHEEIMKQTIAYGYENYSIFFSWESNYLLRIWITQTFISETLNVYPILLSNTLKLIGTKWPLLLIDWNNFIICDVKREADLDNYLNLLFE
jgi:hypothetical protein